MNLFRIKIDAVIWAASDMAAESILVNTLENRAARFQHMRTKKITMAKEISDIENVVPLSAKGRNSATVAELFAPVEPDTIPLFQQ